MFVYLVQPVRVLGQLDVTARQFHRLTEIRQGLEDKRLSGSSVTLVILSDFVIHSHRRPGPRWGLVTVHHVSDNEDLVNEVLHLFRDLLLCEAFTGDIELVGRLVGLPFLHLHLFQVILQFLTPVYAGRVDQETQER